MTKTKHIAVDTDACGGCLSCELACSARHFEGMCDKNLSAIRIDADMLDYYFNAFICKQCNSASCMDACKFDAFFIDSQTGARYIDHEKCKACGACIRACPFKEDKIQRIRKETYNGKKVIIKCDLCHGYEDGPYCIQVCPKAAIKLV